MKADLPVLRTFEAQCVSFDIRMKKGRELLINGIKAAHKGWRDAGYENVLKMALAIDQDVQSIENMVSSQVLPYVQETRERLEKQPY